MDHVLLYPRGGIVLEQYNNDAQPWGEIEETSLILSAVSYETHIHSRTLKGEIPGMGMRGSMSTTEGNTDREEASQGGGRDERGK